MAYDFPNAPLPGQVYQNWTWDSEKWVQTGNPAASGAVRYDLPQGLNANQMAQGRANIAVTKKNYILNGAMMISQENGGAVGHTFVYYPVDQWSMTGSNLNVPTVDFAQVASLTPAGSPNRIRVTATNANAAPGTMIAILTQRIEGARVADLAWGTARAKQVTVQFGMKTPVAGTYFLGLVNSGATAAISGTVSVSAGEISTDIVRSITFTGPTSGTGWNMDNNLGMELQICLTNAANQTANVFATVGNVFELFDVSLTEGTVAPPFQMPDYASELALCQRYWEKGRSSWDGLVPTAVAVGTVVTYKIVKRASPTIVQTNVSASGFPATPANDLTVPGATLGFKSYRISNTANASAFSDDWTANARL